MFGYLLACAIFTLVIGALLLWLGQRFRNESGMPIGEVIYSDTSEWHELEKPLINRRYGLVGRPDYLVELQEKSQTGKRLTIPIEVKSRKRPSIPFDSHILQLATYCLLVEEVHKQRPPYGLLHYADATLQIPFTDQLRTQVINSADAIRRGRTAPDVERQHTDPRRCQGCGYRHACEDAL